MGAGRSACASENIKSTIEVRLGVGHRHRTTSTRCLDPAMDSYNSSSLFVPSLFLIPEELVICPGKSSLISTAVKTSLTYSNYQVSGLDSLSRESGSLIRRFFLCQLSPCLGAVLPYCRLGSPRCFFFYQICSPTYFVVGRFQSSDHG